MHVSVWAEEAEVSVCGLVGFHSLKGFEGVVEYAGCGVEAEVLVGCYSRGKPALGGGPFYGKHVVGEGAAKDEFFGRDKGLWGGSFGYGKDVGVDVGEFGDGGFLGLDAVEFLAGPIGSRYCCCVCS